MFHFDHLLYLVFVAADEGDAWFSANGDQEKAVKAFLIKYGPKLSDDNRVECKEDTRHLIESYTFMRKGDVFFMKSHMSSVWRQVKWIRFQVHKQLGPPQRMSE